jgi:hypothetical protein
MSEREALAKSPPDWRAVAELRAAEVAQLREALRVVDDLMEKVQRDIRRTLANLGDTPDECQE